MTDPERETVFEKIAAETISLPNGRAWRKIAKLLRAQGYGFIGYPRQQVWALRRQLLKADSQAHARAGATNHNS